MIQPFKLKLKFLLKILELKITIIKLLLGFYYNYLLSSIQILDAS